MYGVVGLLSRVEICSVNFNLVANPAESPSDYCQSYTAFCVGGIPDGDQEELRFHSPGKHVVQL